MLRALAVPGLPHMNSMCPTFCFLLAHEGSEQTQTKFQDRSNVKLQKLKKKQGQVFQLLCTEHTILYAGIWLSRNRL